MKLLFSICLLVISGLAVSAQKGEVQKYSSDAEVPRITIEDAKKGFDDGSVFFVDARAEDIYKQEHIKGAVIINGAEDNRFDALPKGKKIIVYCS